MEISKGELTHEKDIIGKIMPVDGEGCWQNADFLDGKHGSEYATANQYKKADSEIPGIKANGSVLQIDPANEVNLTPKTSTLCRLIIHAY